MADAPKVLLDIPFDQWGRALGLADGETYRIRQIQEWIFPKRAQSFAEMTNLPAEYRERWDKTFRISSLALERKEESAKDGTARLFFRTTDGKPVSTVFLPSRDEERVSLCMSTQVGCAWGCVFCASGRVPYERNLTVSEILGQVFGAEKAYGRKIDSLLFMGMGEPLANFENLRHALEIIRSPLGLGYGARHVTVSTSGLVPAINRLAAEAPRVNLAVSLHAADDETRRRLLPKSSAWPIKDLLHASWDFQKLAGAGSRVTFEYILLAGINDSLRAAQRLSNLLRGKPAWVNLIVYNPVPGLPYKQPDEEAVKNFAKVLEERGLFVRVRKPQGTDIDAGCGQLGAPRRIGAPPAEAALESPAVVETAPVPAAPAADVSAAAPPPPAKPAVPVKTWKPAAGKPAWKPRPAGGKPAWKGRAGGPAGKPWVKKEGWKPRPKADRPAGAEGKPPKRWDGPGGKPNTGRPAGPGAKPWARPAGPGAKPWAKPAWKDKKPFTGGKSFGKPKVRPAGNPSPWKSKRRPGERAPNRPPRPK